MKKLVWLVGVVLMLTSCTENSRAKVWGGKMSIDVPKGNRVTNITWKKGDLWYSYRPFTSGEEPATQTFVENSQFGMMEGTVTFIESK